MTDQDKSPLDRYTGLQQWLIWLAVMAAICTVLAGAFQLNQINIGMYLVIGGLGLGLLVKGYNDAAFLQNETELANEQIAILERVDDFDSFLEQAPNSIFRDHIENLNTIALFHSEINQDNLIEILHARLRARSQVSELFAGILVTLGLIGTIVGLIVMMNSLATIMLDHGGGSDELLVALANPDTGPLSGLGIAFYTTLLGAIFGGVVLRVLSSVIDANIRRYTALLAELTEVYVLPFMRSNAMKQHSPSSE